MDFRFILLRYGEIFLKGQNKGFFERKLRDNIQILSGVKKIKDVRGRLIIDYFPEHNQLKKVFGLVSYSPAIKVNADFEEIKKASLELLKEKTGTFKIEPKRSDKRFPITSPEINIQLGRFIEANTRLKFDGQHPDHILGVEINQDGAYLFSEIVYCHGGLPTGVEGRVGALIENDADVLAALLFMKRGCDIFPFGFKTQNIELLQKFSPMKMELKLIKDYAELNQVIQAEKIQAIVSGQNFGHYKKYVFNEIVLRPLIAYSEEEIKKWLEIYDEN